MFFFFSKRVDSIPHSLLLSKLEAIGLDPHIITWIHNCLAERQQRVVFNGMSSVPSSVVSWVPQGSILGPLLFFIYIDDITQVNLFAVSKLILYTDDILLYRPIFLEDYHIFQSNIDALANWTTSNSMSFNVSKCKTMIISRKKNHGSSFPPLILNGSILDVVPTF